MHSWDNLQLVYNEFDKLRVPACLVGMPCTCSSLISSKGLFLYLRLSVRIICASNNVVYNCRTIV